MKNPITEIIQNAKTPMSFIIFYFFGNLLSVFNYSLYVRFNEERYGPQRVNAYLAFTIIGGISFLLWSAVHWTWASKYAGDLKCRMNHVGYGMVVIFALHDLPLFFIEYSMVLCCGGLHNGWQGISFVYLWFEFILSFVWTWSYYTWWAASWMQKIYGASYAGVTFMSPEELERRSQSPPGLPMSEGIPTRSPFGTSRRSQPPTHRAAEVDPSAYMEREMHPSDVQKPKHQNSAPFGGSPMQQMPRGRSERYIVEEREIQPRMQQYTAPQQYTAAPFGASPPAMKPQPARYPSVLMPQPSTSGSTLHRGASTVGGLNQASPNGGVPAPNSSPPSGQIVPKFRY